MKAVDHRTGLKTTKQIMLLAFSERGFSNTVICTIRHANDETIRPIFQRHILPGTEIHTDGAPVYQNIPGWVNYLHKHVVHKNGEFVRYEGETFVSSNHVEGLSSIW